MFSAGCFLSWTLPQRSVIEAVKGADNDDVLEDDKLPFARRNAWASPHVLKLLKTAPPNPNVLMGSRKTKETSQ